MENDGKYYKYTYKLGMDKIEISETDYHEDEELGTVSLSIDNLGNWEFYMYSESDENKSSFIRKISRILSEDDQAASRSAATAHGRYMAFQEIWRN